MKNKLLIAGVASMLYACGGGNTYTINGTVPDSTSDSTMVYISDYSDAQSFADSCMIVDSKFTFTGKVVDSVSFVRLFTGGNTRYFANFVIEPEVVNVDLGRPSKVSGGKLNALYVSYNSEIDSVKKHYQQQMYESTSEATVDSLSALLTSSYDQVVQKYLAGNEKNPLGVALVWDIVLKTSASGKEKLDLIDSVMVKGGDLVKNFKPIQSIRAATENRLKTAEGEMFVDFDAMNPDDSAAKLSDYVGKGNYVLVDFWASWCGPCKAEVPTIREVYNTYKDKGLVVLGVNVWDSKEKCLAAIEQEDMPWSHIYQATTTVPTTTYGINGIPHIILFAPDGKIVARGLRGDNMKAKIAEIYSK